MAAEVEQALLIAQLAQASPGHAILLCARRQRVFLSVEEPKPICQ